jgi:hypothetical protein
MRRLNLPIAVLIALTIPLGGLVAAAPAVAAYNISAVYKDCENNGQLTGHYSRAQLQAALSQLPTQVAEYSACADVIRQAIIRASSHGGGHSGNGGTTAAGGGGGGGSNGRGGSGHAGSGANAAKDGTSSLKHGGAAGTGGSANAITLSGSNVRPGGTGSGSSSLPVALIIVLVLLALTAVSGGALAIRRRVFARHST